MTVPSGAPDVIVAPSREAREDAESREDASTHLAEPAPDPGTGGDQRPDSLFTRSRAVLPILAVLGGSVLLAAFRIQGSSVGVYDEVLADPSTDSGLLRGSARPIRSDEWLVRTPWVLRQTANGFDRYVLGGVGRHDAGLLADLPVLTWQMVLRPHHFGYLLLPTETAFALEWWMVQAVQFIGVYLLLYVLSRRVGVAAACAALVTLSPASQWWTGPATFLTLGYGCLAGAFAVMAVRNSLRIRRVLYAVLAAWSGAAFLVTLYPPWQIPVALTVGVVCAAAIARDCWPGSSRAGWIRLTTTLAAVVLGAGVLAALYVLDHREAVSTVSSTVYPGERVDERGGTVSPPRVFGGALDSFASDPGVSTVNGVNPSENASGLYLIAPVGFAALVVLGTGRIRRRHLPLVSLLGVGAVLTSWMLLPLPSWLGSFLLLNRVPPGRLLLPTVLVGALLLGVLVALRSEEGGQVSRFGLTWILLLFAGLQFWAAGLYTTDDQPISLRQAAVLVLIVSIGAMLTLTSRSSLGLAVLVGFTFWQAMLINPLQVGIPELLDGEVRQAIDEIGADLPEDTGWLSFTSNSVVRGTLTASGANALSAVSPYPDHEAFTVLDPTGDYEDVWNRYAFVFFVPAPAGTSPSFVLNQPDSLTITIDPCDRRLDQLDVGVIISEQPLTDSCLDLIDVVETGNTALRFYRHN